MFVGVSANIDGGATTPLGFVCSQEKHSFEVVGATTEQQSNNQSEQTEDRRENLNDQDLDETVSALDCCPGFICGPRPGTYSEGSAASANAALEPLMPTLTPQIKLHMPTSVPLQNRAYPV
jgi:hypothetical protein